MYLLLPPPPPSLSLSLSQSRCPTQEPLSISLPLPAYPCPGQLDTEALVGCRERLRLLMEAGRVSGDQSRGSVTKRLSTFETRIAGITPLHRLPNNLNNSPRSKLSLSLSPLLSTRQAMCCEDPHPAEQLVLVDTVTSVVMKTRRPTPVHLHSRAWHDGPQRLAPGARDSTSTGVSPLQDRGEKPPFFLSVCVCPLDTYAYAKPGLH